MKPFIKPRVVAPAAAPQQPKVSSNELAVAAVAGAMADAEERAAYLDRVCGGDRELRARIERRLADKELPVVASRAELMPVAAARAAGSGAMALVPMPDMQMTPTGQAGASKHSPIPWILATVLAAAVGALVVVFSSEKSARAMAENDAKTARAAAESAEGERATAMAGALEAKTIAARTEEKRQAADRERTEAEAKKIAAEAASLKFQAEASQSRIATETAKAELERLRKESADAQKTSRGEFATTLAKYAAALVDQGKHGEAEAPARQALELRAAIDPAAWATHDSRYTLGAALMGKGDMPNAEKELLAAIAGMEPFLPQGGDPVKARYAIAVKKLAQLYSATGRKREASEWRRKLDVR